MGTCFFVEPLPPHPSLEHQQKLAKRLLREVWAGDPDAVARVHGSMKLHGAQLAVARGYGFDSWAAMKRKIESLTQTPLEQFDGAVREGDAGRARELLAKHPDIRAKINDPRFDYDSPAIHQAKKNLPLVDVLLEYGADINARSAYAAGGFGILEFDLTLDQARPLLERGAKLTPWAAAGLGLPNELKSILAATPTVVHERGGDGKTVLHCAATREIVEMLVDAGAELDARDADHNSTALQYLIADEGIARLLIDRGATVDIFAAARLGDSHLVEKCLRDDPESAEARVNRPPFVGPGLHIYGWILGFDVTPAGSLHGWDTGHPRDHARTVQMLLEAGSPLDPTWLPSGNDELDAVMRAWLNRRDRHGN